MVSFSIRVVYKVNVAINKWVRAKEISCTMRKIIYLCNECAHCRVSMGMGCGLQLPKYPHIALFAYGCW